ncbi:MAG: periplasmic heavy metal sensor [Thermodesulfovibrionales bacterium]
MKRLLVGMFLGLLSTIFLSHNSYAETCGPIDDHGRGWRDEGMHMAPPPMRSPVMNIMEEIPGAENLMWEHLMGLGLDEQQREAIKEIKSKVIKEAIRKRADERIAGVELKELLDKDPVDMKAVEAKLKQIETLKTEMYLSLITATEEVKSKLAPEQRKKFREMQEMDPPGPHMRGGMMRGGVMRMMPPPPCEKKEEIQQDIEHMIHKAK